MAQTVFFLAEHTYVGKFISHVQSVRQVLLSLSTGLLLDLDGSDRLQIGLEVD